MTIPCCRLLEVYFISVTARKKVWELLEVPLLSYGLIFPLAVQSFCVCLFLTALVILCLFQTSQYVPCLFSSTFWLTLKNFCNHCCLINSDHKPQLLWQFCSNIYMIGGFICFYEFYIHGSVQRESICNNCPTRCDLFSLLHFCRQLHMFQVLILPIIRSLCNCNYSFWYWLTGSTTIRSHCWVGTDSCVSYGTYRTIHMNQFQHINKNGWF